MKRPKTKNTCELSHANNSHEQNNDEIDETNYDNANDIVSDLSLSTYTYNIIIYVQNKGGKIIYFIFYVSKLYLLWILLHYFASHLYIKFCVPKTLIGFVLSPFLTATPHCQGLRWVVYNGANMISNMWVMLGSWICSTILVINNENK